MGLFGSVSASQVDQLHRRVRRLEALVESLARQAGLSEAQVAELQGPPVSAEVRQLVLEGKKIQAIKVHRDQTGLGLKEAKDDVEAL